MSLLLPRRGIQDSQKIRGKNQRFAGPVQKQKLPPSITKYFHVMGGECNYLLNLDETYGLQFVSNEDWATVEQYGWREGRICKLFWTERRFS